MIEQFFRDHQYTIAAIGAISTLLAVVISLWLAIGSAGANRSKLSARATITTLIPHGAIPASLPTYVTAEIVNIGALPLRLGFSFFRMRLPFQRGSAMFTLEDAFSNPLIPKKQYPVEVQPNSSATLFVSERNAFLKNLIEMRDRLTWFDRIRFRHFRLFVLTDDGQWFRVKVDPPLRRAFDEKRLRRLK